MLHLGRFILVPAIWLMSLGALAAGPEVSVLSFKEWKSEKVQESLAEVVRLRTRIEQVKRQQDEVLAVSLFQEVMAASERSPAIVPGMPATAALQNRLLTYEQALARAQFNLEVVRDLSVTDYFVLYLAHEADKRNAFVRAAKKLDPEEVAELLVAYEQTLLGPPTADAFHLEAEGHL